ncbi:substrate-binding periplasmic protein [Thalassotalea euphylliae]|uniref:Amino acid ABC transporter substrate-binding protein n=1 Tax=Thalassotalea euphylliae TaxID=1655234 RepID=A0A3E0TIM2_9GAMM|nr:transporter substrate-binding domain-containing protein [Thalassotalea euphylliae]REL24391.1 amino acid ABC transporter substrate-binding protein [Thalassotalea euphylliae]
MQQNGFTLKFKNTRLTILASVLCVLITLIFSHRSYAQKNAETKAQTNTQTKAQTITLAVGHDHQNMLENRYDIYKANWDALKMGLKDMGHELKASAAPWARAKAYVQSGKLDGLFIAARLPKRDKWAEFTDTIGYEIYGFFERQNFVPPAQIYAGIRLGGEDRVLSYIPPEKLFYVPTAQRGLELLNQGKVDRFAMSYGYGEYLLKTELKDFKSNIKFNPSESETRSLHIAVSKRHPNKTQVLNILNKAIAHSIAKGYYQAAMEKNKVPKRMWVHSVASIN